MAMTDEAGNGRIPRDLIEQGPAVAICFTGAPENRSIAFMTSNISRYGYNHQDFMSGRLRWEDVIHPDDLAAVEEATGRNLGAGADRYETVYRIRTAEGETAWISDLTTVMRGEDGTPLYADCILSDYTALQESKERIDLALRHSRSTLEGVLDSVPAYLYVIDPMSRELAFANRAGRQGLEPGEGEQTGQALYRWILAWLEEQVDLPGLMELLEEECPLSFEAALEEPGCWICVQCRGVTWLDGREYLLFSGRDVSEGHRQEEYIRRMAYIDHLTGLPNRYRCDTELEEAVSSARQTGRTGYILFLDLDDFKVINDGYGHDYGDALLIEFASYLTNHRLPGDRVFRFGGDEFVLLVVPDNAASIHTVVSGLIERCRQPWAVLDKSFFCTISMGVVAFPDGDMGVGDILKNADVAMYEAKKQGKNSFVFYTAEQRSSSIERAQLERLLRESIRQEFKGFHIHYQPFVELNGGRAAGAEALLRWRGPDGRLIGPGSFIPLAEYLGLIVELGRYVLTDACRLLRQLNDSGFPDFTVSVNLSWRQLRQQDILLQVEEVLAETGANPRNLIFEITEGAALSDLQRVGILCGELRKMGIAIAMDDFGSGYSSLSNLRDTLVDLIKIDRPFIKTVGQDRYSHSFIRLVTDFGHATGKKICVEGVETQAQLDYCRYAGVDLMQGFYFFKPMPRENLLEYLLDPEN